MRINPSNPNAPKLPQPGRAGGAADPAAGASASDRLLTQSGRLPYHDVVPGRDALTFTLNSGATLHTIAKQFAPDYAGDNTFGQADPKDAERFMKALKKANGIWFGGLRAGKSFTVPTQEQGTNPALLMAIAVQKSMDQRRKAGAHLPELDYAQVKLESGPAESFKLSVKGKGRSGFETFYVAEDLSGERPHGYQVFLPSEMPLVAPHKPATTVTPGLTRLKVTVTPGQTLWSLAKAFAPDLDADKALESPEIKAYIETIKRANKLKSDTIGIGQTLLLPSSQTGVSTNLRLAMAVQQSFDARRKGGEAVPVLDYTTVKLEKTTQGAAIVSFRLHEDPAVQTLAVKPDATGRYPNGFDVYLPHEAPEYFD
jgi:LysM repeat protein